MCVCVYIYIYACIHTYLSTYIHINPSSNYSPLPSPPFVSQIAMLLRIIKTVIVILIIYTTILSPGSTLTVRLADASYEVVVPEVKDCRITRGNPNCNTTTSNC